MAKNRLTPKQKRFVKEKVDGKSDYKAYEAAGYSTNTNAQAVRSNAQKLKNQDKIQNAIDLALAYHGATPEFAVGRLKSIAEQDEELGASRLASKDILELHGWSKNNKPHVTLAIKSSFFTEARPRKVDVEG